MKNWEWKQKMKNYLHTQHDENGARIVVDLIYNFRR